MFRMSRAQWLSRFFRMPTPMAKVKRKKRDKAIKHFWHIILPKTFQRFTAQAYTASEARATVKQALGMDSLPTGTLVERIEADEAKAAA